MQTNRCIWCSGNATDDHVEHIIPEALGCPPNFTLPGTVVCRKCNNGLAYLDRAVADEFDFIKFIAGVPRKGNKTPVVSSRSNVFGSIEAGTPTLSFNMEKHPVLAHNGSRLAPYRKSHRSIDAKLDVLDQRANISFEATFGDSPNFVRGLTKIAFSSLVYFLGSTTALESDFDPVRQFVHSGIGSRHVMLSASSDTQYRNSAGPPYRQDTGFFVVTFRIAHIEFLLDLSPNESMLPILEAKQLQQAGTDGWCVIPLRS
jgi:hypothetical protein